MNRDGLTSSLMLDTLAIAAGRCPTEADPVAALLAADLSELIADIYDRLSDDHPRQLLTGRRLGALLRLIGLPEPGLPSIVSYADVNTVLTDKFADAFGVTARRSSQSVGDVLETLMVDPNAAETDWNNLRVLAALDELRGLNRKRVVDERAILAALTQDNLARTVMRQQEHIKRLRSLAVDLTTELRRTSAEALAAQTLLSMTERKPSIDNTHPIERSRSAGCFVGQLEALRSKLQRLRPTVKELERRQTIMEQSWSSQSSKPCSTANESGTQFGDKSCAEDSGWMTDDDFDGTESRTISQCSSDKALDFDSNTLPIITSGRLSVARLKGTESLNCNDATTTHFRTRLASLSVKLRDTERKLSALSKSDYSSSNSDESGPVSVQ